MPPLRWSLPARLRRDYGEIALAAAAALYALTLGLLRLEPIEIGGDAINKWHFARQWFYRFDFSDVVWDHHLSRFGVNVPVGLTQLVFGREADVYYVPATAVLVSVALVTYLIGRMAHGKAAGVLATLWFMSFPSWVRAGSQITPDAFGAVYVGIATLCLLMYARVERHRLVWLCASALALGFSYLAKEPFASFVGGGMIATYLISRNLRHTALYAAVPIGLFLVESIFYRLVSDYSSRLALVSTTHGRRPIIIKSFFDVFGRFTTLPDYWHVLLAVALVGALALPFLVADRRKIWPLIWLPLVFFAFYTFAIRRLNPISLWSRFMSRYLDVGVPFAAVLASVFLVALVFFLARRFVPRALEFLDHHARFGWIAGCVVFFLFGLRAYVKDPPGPRHPIATTRKIHAVLNDTYRRGLPIVAPRGDTDTKRRTLKAAYKLYLDDDLLAVNGKLLNYADIPTPEGRLVKRGVAASNPGCELEIWASGRFLRLSRMTPLPSNCVAKPL
jgi:hypothetical protein